MLHVIDLRSDDQETKDLYENVFKPFAELILALKLYQDRTVKDSIKGVAKNSVSLIAKMIYQDVKDIKSLSYLNGDQKDYIFAYWFRTQIESKIFILDPNYEYLAYNGRISQLVKSNIKGVINSNNFLRFDKNLKSIAQIPIELWENRMFVTESNF
jgi:hypothetical protein